MSYADDGTGTGRPATAVPGGSGVDRHRLADGRTGARMLVVPVLATDREDPIPASDPPVESRA